MPGRELLLSEIAPIVSDVRAWKMDFDRICAEC
jgi:hypothetical protein